MKHLISVAELSREEAIAILDTAIEMADVNDREIKKLPSLRGKTVVNLFFEDSTRTRNSFEVAAKRLSADVLNFTAKGSSVSKGESLKDTAQTLEAMGADIVVVRHPASGAAHALANRGWIKSSVVNAGDGTHEHPTQALLDAFTLRSHMYDEPRGKGLDGLSVAIIGDIAHSRVARSNLILLKKLGATVSLIGPATLIPKGLTTAADSVFYSLDEAIAAVEFDAVMLLRVQLERMTASFFPSEREYAKIWGFNAERHANLKPGALVMHPGPMNRGLEIDAASADHVDSVILEQVANGVNVRMSVLFHLLAKGERND